MFKKYNISLMDNNWEIIDPNIKFKYIPRFGELIYLTKLGQYYKVINVIHNITNKHEIFIIVELFDK